MLLHEYSYPTFRTSSGGIDNLKFIRYICMLLDIVTLNTDKERGSKTFCLIIILYCLGMPVFVNHRVVIAETFAEKHFC
jgi:hypothetical protein